LQQSLYAASDSTSPRMLFRKRRVVFRRKVKGVAASESDDEAVLHLASRRPCSIPQSSLFQVKKVNCSVCYDLDPERLKLKQEIPLQEPLATLDAAASAGCHACALLCSGLQGFDSWKEYHSLRMRVTKAGQLYLEVKGRKLSFTKSSSFLRLKVWYNPSI